MQSRYAERQGESMDTRLRLLEYDADEIDRKVGAINAKLDWILRALLTATLTLAANLVMRLVQI